MKRSLFAGGVTLFCLFVLVGGWFVSSFPVLARSVQSIVIVEVSESNPYCRVYIQYLARRLHISVETLLREKLAAKRDVLDQLVKEGKLSRAQAEIDAARTATDQAINPCS